MRKRWSDVLLAGALLAGTGLALAIDFTWTGTGSTPDWADNENWCTTEPCPLGYPDGTNDTAAFPDNGAGTWTATQTAETIGELKIEEDVDLDGAVTLTTDKLVIDAAGRTADIDVTVTLANGKLVANP